MRFSPVDLQSKRGNWLVAAPLRKGKTVLSTDLVPLGFGASVSCELELSQSVRPVYQLPFLMRRIIESLSKKEHKE